MKKFTRRSFVSGTAKAAAALAAFGSAPFAIGRTDSTPSANERIGIGVIGLGWFGADHLMRYMLEHRKRLNVEVVALCDVWQVHLDRAAERAQEELGRAPKTYVRYRDLLEDPDVDAVMIATPDFSHCPILVDAARAGKHVFVEKPLANRIEDANAAVDAIEESGVVCQVNTQRRSNPRFIGGAKLIQSGILGRLARIECTWPTAGPRWRKNYDDVREEDVDWEAFLMDLPREEFDPKRFRCWQLYKDFTNGIIGILGSHLIDVANWYSEDPFPERCVGFGDNIVFSDRESHDAQECVFHYPGGHLMRFSGRLGNGHPTRHVAFYGTKGYFDTLDFTATGQGARRGDRIEEPVEAEAVEGDHHNDNWIDCIRRNDPSTRADIHAGYAHAVAAILGFQAIEQRRELRYDSGSRTIEPTV